MTYKPKRVVGLTIVITLTAVLFTAVVPRTAYAPAEDAWADPSCKYRMKLTFKGTNPSVSLSDFPVLVTLTSSRIDYGKTSATDIRFFDSTGKLSKETELWNSAGNSYIWVKIPQMETSGTDYFYAYYGSLGGNELDDAGNLWSSYAMVQHMNETISSGSKIYDRTANDNDGTVASGVLPKRVSGKIGYAFSFNGSDSTNGGSVSIADKTHPLDSLDFDFSSFSYSFWFTSRKSAGVVKTQDVFDKRGGTAGATNKGYKFTISTTSTVGYSPSLGNSSSGTKGNVRLNTNTDGSWGANVWALATVVVDRGNSKIIAYVNSVWKNETAIPTGFGNLTNQNNLILGKNLAANDRYFNGSLDEVRVSSGAWTQQYTRADYNSTTDNLINYGPPELRTTALTVSCDPSTINKLGSQTTKIAGYLTSGSSGISGKTIKLYYQAGAGGPDDDPPTDGTWTEIAQSSTGGFGYYSYDWNPPDNLANGYYWVNATFAGDADYARSSKTTGVDVLMPNLFVIPEYAIGTVLALAMCFGGVFVYRRYKNNRLKPF